MYLRVNITPNAKTDQVTKLTSEKYDIAVKAKAEHGQANKKLLELLAEKLHLPVSRLRIISGHHQPHKLISVRDLTPDETAEAEQAKAKTAAEQINDVPPDLPRHLFHFKV